jgi:hypothetical protein
MSQCPEPRITKPALLYQEIARSFFSGQHGHRHRQGRLRKASEIPSILLFLFCVIDHALKIDDYYRLISDDPGIVSWRNVKYVADL